MKPWTKGMVSGLAAVAIGACAAMVGAQPGGTGRLWNAKTVETVSGEVMEVQQIAFPGGKAHGVHLVVKTDATPDLGVHLGPSWYLEQQTLKVAKGDRVTIKGSRVTLDGKPVLLAAELQKGDQTLVLRDENGVPRWSGGSGRQRGKRAPSSS